MENENNVVEGTVQNIAEEQIKQPTLEVGNYLLEIKDKTGLLKKIVVTNGEVYVTKLKEGGLVIDIG